MKKNKLTQIAAALIFIGISQHASAQWAVFDYANTAQNTITAAANKAMAALEAYYKPRQDAQQSAMVNAQNGTNASIDALAKQQVLQAKDTDMRLRKALGDSENAKRLLDSFPTIAQCAEISKNNIGTSQNNAVVASIRKYGDGPSGKNARVAAVTSTAAAIGQVLSQKKSLGTCKPELKGAAGCQGETDPYAGGDTEVKGIKGNIKGLNDDKVKNQPEFNNYTFDQNGLEVAKKYATDASMYDAPKKADSTALAKNPSYAASYENMMSKLNAANGVLMDVVKMRAPSDPASNINDYWSKVQEADYQRVTGFKSKDKPKNPSMFEMLNYRVSNDFIGNTDAAKNSSTEELNNRLALNNYIMWQQYKQQENTNILLSHILVQSVTPISKGQVDAEFNKTMSYK